MNLSEYFQFMIILLCSIYIFYNIVPKMNPYMFPKVHEIDMHTYIDNTGKCYTYERQYM